MVEIITVEERKILAELAALSTEGVLSTQVTLCRVLLKIVDRVEYLEQIFEGEPE